MAQPSITQSLSMGIPNKRGALDCLKKIIKQQTGNECLSNVGFNLLFSSSEIPGSNLSEMMGGFQTLILSYKKNDTQSTHARSAQSISGYDQRGNRSALKCIQVVNWLTQFVVGAPVFTSDYIKTDEVSDY